MLFKIRQNFTPKRRALVLKSWVAQELKMNPYTSSQKLIDKLNKINPEQMGVEDYFKLKGVLERVHGSKKVNHPGSPVPIPIPITELKDEIINALQKGIFTRQN